MKPLDPALRPHLAPARRPLAVATGATILGGALLVAQAWAVGTLVVTMVRGEALSGAATATFGVLLARAVLGVVVDLATARAAGQVSTALRGKVLTGFLGEVSGVADRRRVGEVAVLLTRGLGATEPWFTRYLPALAVAGVVPLLTLAAIAWLDPLSGLVVVLTLPLVPVFAILVGLATRDRADRQWRLLASLSGHFVDVVRGLPTLVAHRRAKAQVETIRSVTHRHRVASLATLRLAFASSVILELLATLSVALVAVTVGLRLAAGSLDFRTALVVLLLAPEAYWPLRRVGAEFHAAAEGAAVFGEVDELLRGPEKVRHSGGSRDETGLVLQDVVVGWNDHPVARPVTARMGRGLTAVVGPSGSGKSTLLAALVGEHAPLAGSLSVLGRTSPDDWRQLVAWVPQRPWLTAGSIADNLRVADPDAADARLWQALERVDLAHVVLTLPAGLDTVLGEDGSGLSAGERARLALARVLVSERPVVVLDEPTAHLDAETEAVTTQVVRDLARSRTVIVVAHRPALVEMADHVVTMTAATHRPATTRPATTKAAEAPSWRPSQRADLGAIALGALSAASGVALTATAGWLITRASEQPPVLTLMVAIVGVRAFGLARPVLRYAERIVSHEQALGLLAERRAEVYAALVPLVPGRLGRPGRRRGDLLTSLVDDVDALVDERVRVRVPLWTGVLVAAGALLMAGWLAPAAALVLAVPVLTTAVVAALVARSARSAEAAYVDGRSRLGAVVEGTLTDARHLVAWQRDDAAVRAVLECSDDLAASSERAARSPAWGQAAVLAATGAAVALTPWTVGGLAPATAALLVLLPLALHEVLGPVVDAVVTRARCTAATHRIDTLVGSIPAVVDPAEPVAWPSHHPVVDATGVGAAVPVDLRLLPGDRVGVVGPSGSGKSTLAAQLIRFLDPPGSVRFGGVDARALALHDIRGHVALVDDDPYLFATSVVENVRLARPDASDDDVLAALGVAGLATWVDAVGLHTLIGAGHRDVSGGERARLGLARAVLGDQPVVVLDEPTAHLDSSTAAAVTRDVLSALEGRSIVWITHESVGLAEMDRVVELSSARAPATTGQPDRA